MRLDGLLDLLAQVRVVKRVGHLTGTHAIIVLVCLSKLIELILLAKPKLLQHSLMHRLHFVR